MGTIKKRVFEGTYDWYAFKYDVLENRRFCHSKKSDNFLKTVASVARSQVKLLDVGQKFYRARIGREESKLKKNKTLFPAKPYSGKDIGIPPHAKRTHGRANPIGIGYLYLATDKETAIAETKPYKSADVSIACFETRKKLRLVDFSSETYKGFFLPADMSYNLAELFKANPDQIEKIIWGQLNFDFAKPLSPEDSQFEYIPTQVIAEKIKENGFDGIIYSSALTFTGGKNITLFSDKFVKERKEDCELVTVKNIKLDISPFEWPTAKRIKNALG